MTEKKEKLTPEEKDLLKKVLLMFVPKNIKAFAAGMATSVVLISFVSLVSNRRPKAKVLN